MTVTDTNWNQPLPSAIDAEQAVLGTLLQAPAASDPVWQLLEPSDFLRPAHQLLAGLLRGMHMAGEHIDPQSVLQGLRKGGHFGAFDNQPGPYLHTLITRAWNPLGVLTYAGEVQRAAQRRALVEHGTRLVQSAENDACEVDDAILRTVRALTDLREGSAALAPEVPTLDELLAGEDDPYDWVIPGLLERGDRMILTGGEGSGKSVLVRELAVAAAAGVHPFTERNCKPQKVLVIDCENGLKQSRRRFRPLRDLAVRYDAPLEDRLRVEVRPAGLDLVSGKDAAWLLRLVTRYRPDLLCVGPLYRLHHGNPNDEEPARAITVALDACRERVGCAVLSEAHSPHGITGARDVRPLGSSLWRRWPEFGYGLSQANDEGAQPGDMHLVPWRGDRDERAWPKRLRRGGDLEWPWMDGSPPQSAWSPHRVLEAM